MAPSPDPYRTLGVAASATDAELRAAYRRLVQLHHPDHNGGSAESERRFEEVQEAYAEARRLRGAGAGATRPSVPSTSATPDLDARLAAMEKELKSAREAGQRAAREARRAAEQTIRDVREMAGKPASNEELGYFSSDDSLSQILDDAAAELSERFTEARDSPAGHRVSDLIDELTHKLSGEHDGKRE